MAHNLLIPTYHCCSSARHAMNIALTRLQPKDTESEYRAALNIEERDPAAHCFTLFDLDFKKENGSDKIGHADKGFVFAERPAWCCVLPSLLLGCMCGRTVGIFNQAIFRSPLVG